MARYRSRGVVPVLPVVATGRESGVPVAPPPGMPLPGARYQVPVLPVVARAGAVWSRPRTATWTGGRPSALGLGQWEALIPVATGLVRGLMDGGGGSGYGAGGAGVGQVATQTSVVTPVQTTSVTVQTGSGQISQPVPSVTGPVPVVQGPGGLAVGPAPGPRAATIIEEPAPGLLAGLPWWVPLAGLGVAAWLLLRD